MTIRIETARLIDLINDLKHTAAVEPEAGPVAGILLHTARGYGFPGDPGVTDILVGTSTNRIAVGHTYVTCYGQMTRPMLWPIKAAIATVSLFKPALGDNPAHTVDIAFDGANIHVEGEGDLFGDGTKFEFAAGDLTKFPRGLWDVLRYNETVDPGLFKTPVSPRTDIPAAAFAAFTAVAKGHGGVIEIYRYHQGRPVLIEIGDRYRGAITPAHWPDDKKLELGRGPQGDVYVPELPDPDPVDIRSDSHLERAAEVILTTGSAGPSLLQRRLKLGARRVGELLGELELIGVVGPADGALPRDVLLRSDQLGIAVRAIRTREAAAAAEQEALNVE
jgi:hypothetical protein